MKKNLQCLLALALLTGLSAHEVFAQNEEEDKSSFSYKRINLTLGLGRVRLPTIVDLSIPEETKPIFTADGGIVDVGFGVGLNPRATLWLVASSMYFPIKRYSDGEVIDYRETWGFEFLEQFSFVCHQRFQPYVKLGVARLYWGYSRFEGDDYSTTFYYSACGFGLVAALGLDCFLTSKFSASGELFIKHITFRGGLVEEYERNTVNTLGFTLTTMGFKVNFNFFLF